jgi:hypothetical protein
VRAFGLEARDGIRVELGIVVQEEAVEAAFVKKRYEARVVAFRFGVQQVLGSGRLTPALTLNYDDSLARWRPHPNVGSIAFDDLSAHGKPTN